MTWILGGHRARDRSAHVEFANRIEDALRIRTEVLPRQAIKPRSWEIIQEDLVDVPVGR